MSLLYLKVGDDIYYLDSTSRVTYSTPGSLSIHPLESGKSAADNYIEGPKTVSINGVISDIKSASHPLQQAKSTAEFLDGLQKAKRDHLPISVRYRTDKDPEANYFFVDLQTEQNGKKGSVGGVINAYEISCTLQQAIYAESAIYTTEPPQAYIDAFKQRLINAQNAREAAEEARQRWARDIQTSGITGSFRVLQANPNSIPSINIQ